MSVTDLMQDNQDYQDLCRAVRLLESPSLAVKLVSAVGAPLERGLERIPASQRRRIDRLVQAALGTSADVALKTLGSGPASRSADLAHAVGAATTGFVSGFFGYLGLAVELPVTTTLIMRSIMDVARSEGFDVQQPEVRLQCLQVFALGGPQDDDDAMETGYYAVRTALASTLSGLAREGSLLFGAISGTQTAAMMAGLVRAVASRFGVVVTEKMAAQLIPVLGATAGAAINTLFMNHFQDMARGHFIVQRLERRHGVEVVRQAYRQVLGQERELAPLPLPRLPARRLD